MRTTRLPPTPAARAALAELGAGLRALRLMRRMPMTYAAERAGISRSTLHKIERGDPGVALGIYADLLATYGLLERLARLADPGRDREGLRLERAHLPRRVRPSAHETASREVTWGREPRDPLGR
jgi:transcriptional regulator with XRE-family HTH domain